MFCTNCGSQIEDDAMFCPECGQRMDAETTNESSVQMEDAFGGYSTPLPNDMGTFGQGNPQPINNNMGSTFCPMCGNQINVGAEWCPACGAALGQAEGAAPRAKKKSVVPLLVAGVAVVGIALVGTNLLKTNSSKKIGPIFYVKDGDLMANNYKEDKSQQVDRNYDGSSDNWIRMSNDKKYLFYVNDGTLYVKNAKKLEGDETKIARDVDNFTVLENNKVVFLQSDGTLAISNRKDDERIARDDVRDYRINEKQNEIIWLDEEGDLYWQDLALKKDREKIASDVNYIQEYTSDFSKISYVKEDGIYILSKLEKEEHIAEDYTFFRTAVVENDIVMYYGIQSKEETRVNLYDCIIDDMKDEDSKIEQPNYSDYKKIQTYKNEYGDVYEEYEYDDEAYERDYEKYSQKEQRDNERSYLERYEVDMRSTEVYYYSEKTGSQKLRECSEVEVYDVWGDAVIVLKAKEGTQKTNRKLSELSNSDLDFDEFCEQVEASLKGEVQYYIYHNTNCEQLDINKEDLVNVLGRNMEEKTLYIKVSKPDKNYGDLYSVNYGNSLGKMAIVEKEIDEAYVVGKELFYRIGEDWYANGKRMEFDAEKYVSFSELANSDKKIIATFDDSSEYALYMWNGKKATKIEEDIYQWVAMDENHIAMIQDYSTSRWEGDLIYYNGKKTIKLENDVSYLVNY